MNGLTPIAILIVWPDKVAPPEAKVVMEAEIFSCKEIRALEPTRLKLANHPAVKREQSTKPMKNIDFDGGCLGHRSLFSKYYNRKSRRKDFMTAISIVSILKIKAYDTLLVNTRHQRPTYFDAGSQVDWSIQTSSDKDILFDVSTTSGLAL